ncbi:MAG: SRPBCC domain-containing protein [Cyanobacteria bacterium PR.3.49]|nr:SRPBCC domain-containing protein [Cyanobacteria bacterium PR.3.49]
MTTTTSKAEVLTLDVTRIVKAPVELVYKAWTEPAQMINWIGCTKTQSVKVTSDLRVGGEYRFEVSCNDGEQVCMSGTYQKVEPNKKLVYTWNNTSSEFPAKDTLVSVTFIEQGDKTEIRLTHSNLNDANCLHGHTLGWTASLERFVGLFE